MASMIPIIVGLDGGGTKTEAVVATIDGIVGRGRSGPSNHQGVGMDEAASAVTLAVDSALQEAGVPREWVTAAVFGLAGADFPEDYEAYDRALGVTLGPMAFRIVNDTEVALVGGSRTGFGIVVLAGTGTNVLGRSQDGAIVQVGGLGYEWGDFGGGMDLAREVLHHAFRSAERRGVKTVLEDVVLSLTGLKTYAELSRALYFRTIPQENFLMLAPMCFDAAKSGDVVAQKILREMGQKLGESAVGCAKLVGLWGSPHEVVMAGSLWAGVSLEMRKGFLSTLERESPGALPHLPRSRPVAGALLLAAEDAGWPLSHLRTLLSQDDRVKSDLG